MNKLIFTVTVLCAALINASCAQNSAAAPAFTVVRHEADFKLPVIVFPYDRHGQTEFDWEKLSAAKQTQQHLKQKNPTVDAVRYLREGIARMTGRALPVVSGQELSSGIVLAIMADAPPEIRNDPAIDRKSVV